MDERGKGRSDRSRYGSRTERAEGFQQASTPSGSERVRGRYHDSFFDDMLMSDSEPEPDRSFSSRLEEREGSRRRVSREGVRRQRRSGEERTEAELGADAPQGAETEADSSEGSGPPASTGRASTRSDDRATTRTPAKKKQSHRAVLRVVGVIAAVVVLVGIGAAFAYVGSISANLHSGVDDDLRDSLVETDMTNEPFYMLLLGTDGSAERDGEEVYGGAYRSDSMMLVRVDAPEKKVTLISIPRDIPIDFGGDTGVEKINAAYAIGGPSLAVKAVSELAGVDISHYAQVDFDGFASIVDALGGVEVDVPVYINDDEAGGVLQAGEQTLDGQQALILCRSRNTYGDKGDIMRAANQRLVLSAIAKKVLGSDIRTIAYTVQTMSQYVTTDLDLADIIGLAQSFSGMDASADIYTASVPTVSQYVDGGWYEIVDTEEWEAMMARVKQGLPPTSETEVDPATGTVLSTAGGDGPDTGAIYSTVTVKNGTSSEGLATSVRQKLIDEGYVNVVIGDVNEAYSYPDTLVVYDDANREAEAQRILDIVGQGELHLDEQGEYLMDYTDFIVVIGKDWKS